MTTIYRFLRNPTTSERLAPQAKIILGHIESAGSSGIEQAELIANLDNAVRNGKLETRQDVVKLIRFYQRQMEEAGFIAIERSRFETPVKLKEVTGKTFRSTAGFGKRMEFWIIGRLLKEGLDVYIPLVDDHGVDAIIKKSDGTFVEVQIKTRSKDVVLSNAALFAALEHPEVRPNYYFIFYSERMETTWVLTSAQFIELSVQNKNGKNKGKRSIWLNSTKRCPISGQPQEYAKDKFSSYIVEDFSIFK